MKRLGRNVATKRSIGVLLPLASLAWSSPAICRPKGNAHTGGYHLLDPAIAGFTLELNLADITVDSASSIASGEISHAFLHWHGKPYPLKLASDSIAGGKIRTAKFGTLLARANSIGYMEVRLTNSQEKQIRAYLKSLPAENTPPKAAPKTAPNAAPATTHPGTKPAAPVKAVGQTPPVKNVAKNDPVITTGGTANAAQTMANIPNGTASAVTTTTNTTKSNAQPQTEERTKPMALTAGEIAFVRVKQYTTFTGEPNIQDSFGGKGYFLKSLPLQPNSEGVIGIDTPIATPTADAVTVNFGDTVTLIEKTNGLPNMWLVAKGQTKVQLPEYLLTANKAEIDFLKVKGRIPDTMAYVAFKFKDEAIPRFIIWGVYIGGIGNSNVIESHGLALKKLQDGTSPFALKGNAVVFHENDGGFLSQTPVFDRDKKPFVPSSSCIYYCVSDGDKPAFESIDLSRYDEKR